MTEHIIEQSHGHRVIVRTRFSVLFIDGDYEAGTPPRLEVFAGGGIIEIDFEDYSAELYEPPPSAQPSQQ